MGRSCSSSSESSGSTSSSSSSSSTVSAASGRHHKFNSEKRRSHQTEDNKRTTSNARRHGNERNRRGRSRSNSSQRINSDGRKDRNRDKSMGQRVDRARISSVSNERHRRSSGDGRRDKRHSSSLDKRRARKSSSSDDRRSARKRSADKKHQRKRSCSDDKMLNRKRSNSNDSPRRRNRRYDSTDDRRNCIRSHCEDRRRERKRSSSDERNQDKKRSSIGQKRYRKESRSNDKSKRNSRSSDRSLKIQSRKRRGSDDSIKNSKNAKRKSFDKKNRDESANKKSKFEEQSKRDDRSNSRRSQEKNVIIPSIPCKWDRVDDTSREGESDDLIKTDNNKENQEKDANTMKCSDIKSDYESEVNRESLSSKIIKSKIVAEENTQSSYKEKAEIRDSIVERNKLIINDDTTEVTNKEITIKKSLTKDPISFSIKSIRKDHKKKSVGKESKNKSKEVMQKEVIFQSGYETDSESENVVQKSSKHHKRSKKKVSPLMKSVDSEKIMSESEDELQKMKAQLQKELEMEEELERQEKIKIDEKKKPDESQNSDDYLKGSSRPKKSEELKNQIKEHMVDSKTSKRSDKSREFKISHSERKEKFHEIDDKIKDSKISTPDCKINKKDGLKPSATVKEEQKLDKLKNSKENVETPIASVGEKKIKGSTHSHKVGSSKESTDKIKESSLSHIGTSSDKHIENSQNRKENIIKDSSGKKFDDSSSNLEDNKKDSLPYSTGDEKQEELKRQKITNLDTSKTSPSRHDDNKKELGSQPKLLTEDNKDNLKSSSWSGHDSDPLLNELPTHISRQPKTSDTYWNKYAVKLGIIIDDPKFLGDNNGNVNKKRKLSPVEGNRKKKGRDKETADNVTSFDKLRNDASSVSQKEVATPSLKKPVLDPILSRTGGAYIPPARLKMMQDQITDKSSDAYQRLAWEALKKSINGLVNKVNVSNIGIIVRELFKENIVRGRGLLCRALMQAQAFSPTFTHVYAAMVAVLNTKFPQIGELLLHRLVLQLRRGVKRNDKNSCMASCRFIGHLINQQVAHEVVALEILTMLLEKAKDLTDESDVGDKSRKASVELAIAFLKECGMKLSELTPKGLMIVMETLRNILHEGKLDSRFQYMVEVLMAIKKGGFKDYPAVIEELDLVEEDDQFTHVIELDGKLDTQEMLNVFKVDTEYEENEAKYKELKASILGDDSGDESGGEGNSESGAESDDEESETEKGEDGNIIIDRSETNLVAFRRTVYLTIQSSLDVDECAHKLLKGEIKPGWEEELCNMIIDCCAQQRTYMKFYGLLAQRFCMLNKIYQQYFEKIFKDAYETCHRLEIEKLRNVAKLFSHLFFSDAISWISFSCIHLNQDETTSSSRVFLKILFEELGDFMGLCKLNERLRDSTLAPSYEGLLPRDNPVNTRFAINFFTTIGLGGLTDDLREFLRSQPKPTAVVAPVPQTSKDESSDSSSSSSDSSSDDSSSSSESSSDSSSSEDSSSDSDSSSSESSSSDGSLSDSSYSDSSSSEDSSSDDSEKKSSSLKNKKKLLKKLQMEQRKASKKKHGSKDKKKSKEDKHAKANSSKIIKHKNIDEGKAKKLGKNERSNLVFENTKVVEKNSDRRKNNYNSEFNSNHNDHSDDSSGEDTKARRNESSKNIRNQIEENNVGRERQKERYKDINSERRKTDHASDREERIQSRSCSREKSYEPQEKSRRSRNERSLRNSNENSKEKQSEVERRSKMSERSNSSEREEKDDKKSGNKEVETEKNRNKYENYRKEDKKDKRKDLKNDDRKKERRRERDDSEKEEETDSHHRRRNKEKDNKGNENKSKSGRDKDREKKEDRRSRRLSLV